MKVNGIIPAGILRKGLEKANTQVNSQSVTQKNASKNNKPKALQELEKAKQKPKLSLDAVYTADGFINQASKRIDKLEKMAKDLHKISQNNIKKDNYLAKQEKSKKIIEDPQILDVSKKNLDKFMQNSIKAIKNNPEAAITAQANVSNKVANSILNS